MLKWMSVTTVAIVVATGVVWAAGSAGPSESAAAFERLKTLQGTWEAALPNGQRATTTFELVANGTALVERYSNPSLPDGGRMVTMYHLDGSTLLLTHSCIAMNQTTLRATRFDAARGEIQFEFLRATNLASEGAGHMRRATYRLQDANRFVTEWEFFENGKRTMTEVETFTRAK